MSASENQIWRCNNTPKSKIGGLKYFTERKLKRTNDKTKIEREVCVLEVPSYVTTITDYNTLHAGHL